MGEHRWDQDDDLLSPRPTAAPTSSPIVRRARGAAGAAAIAIAASAAGCGSAGDPLPSDAGLDAIASPMPPPQDAGESTDAPEGPTDAGGGEADAGSGGDDAGTSVDASAPIDGGQDGGFVAPMPPPPMPPPPMPPPMPKPSPAR